MWELMSAIDEVEFDLFAYLRAQANGTLMDSPIFGRVLDEIGHIECWGPRAMGVGKKVCLIRESVQREGYRGCWECKEGKNCNTLAPLKRFHGKTIEHNHQMIRQFGLENWSDSGASTTRGGKAPIRSDIPDKLLIVTDIKA